MWYMRDLVRDLRLTPKLENMRFSHPVLPELKLRKGRCIDLIKAAGTVLELGN